jgi:hypothetical protein
VTVSKNATSLSGGVGLGREGKKRKKRGEEENAGWQPKKRRAPINFGSQKFASVR